MTDRVSNGPLIGSGPKQRTPGAAPASALPGENAGKDRVIPAEHAATDMSPNDTLFDAVNRGDLTAARDAIARGADFNARNELGQTPLDESIDLGRNNITFLLLSMRPSPGDSIAPAAPGKPGTPRQTAAAPAAARPSVQSVSVPPAAPKPAAAPVASNPGTPNPQRGFLGFGG